MLRQQFELQKKILAAARSLGISGILPCFSGAVPYALKNRFPNERYTKLTQWNFFPSNETEVLMLDPSSALFHRIGRDFVALLLQEFAPETGDNNDSAVLLACDLYNEVFPSNNSAAYLKQAAANAYGAMQQGVAQQRSTTTKAAVWVMQTWLWSKRFWFWWDKARVEAFLSGVPIGSMLLLDLHAETDPLARYYGGNFFGHQWTWGLLLDYGGRRGLMGNLSSIATQPLHDALTNPNSTQVGFALTPEATHNNPVAFELFTESFFTTNRKDDRITTLSPSTWLPQYVDQRYGFAFSSNNTNKKNTAHHLLQAAWRRLADPAPLQSPYSQNVNPTSDIEHTPSVLWSYSLQSHANFCGNSVHDAGDLLLSALQQLSSSSNHDEINSLLRYDSIDIARMSAVIFFGDLNAAFNTALRLGSGSPSAATFKSLVHSVTTRMIQIISELDVLLSTDENYLLGPYLQLADVYANSSFDASNSSVNNNDMSLEEMRRLVQKNAKSLITVWGPSGPIQLSDYASKPWSGLYSDYYLPRWQMFADLLGNSTSLADFTNHNLGWQISKMMPLDNQFVNTFKTSYPTSAPPNANALLVSTIQKLIQNLTTISANQLAMLYDSKTNATVPAAQRLQLPNGGGAWSTDPLRLGEICRLLGKAVCVGFDSNGFFMTAVTSHDGGHDVKQSDAGESPRFCTPGKVPTLWTLK